MDRRPCDPNATVSAASSSPTRVPFHRRLEQSALVRHLGILTSGDLRLLAVPLMTVKCTRSDSCRIGRFSRSFVALHQ